MTEDAPHRGTFLRVHGRCFSPAATMSRTEAPSEGESPARRAGRAIRQGRRWLDVAEFGEVRAICWVPEDQTLVRVLPRWSAWRLATAILEAGFRVGTYSARNLVLVGPGLFELTGPSWARRLRSWVMDRGVVVSMHTRHWAAATQPGSRG